MMRGGPGAPKPPRPLSPLIQARIDRITQSEIFGPIMRPPPMALFGIAGRDAFIRTPNGQTLMLRVGDEKDGIKLLLIGTNRVLLEQGGEKKELLHGVLSYEYIRIALATTARASRSA